MTHKYRSDHAPHNQPDPQTERESQLSVVSPRSTVPAVAPLLHTQSFENVRRRQHLRAPRFRQGPRHGPPHRRPQGGPRRGPQEGCQEGCARHPHRDHHDAPRGRRARRGGGHPHRPQARHRLHRRHRHRRLLHPPRARVLQARRRALNPPPIAAAVQRG